MYSQQELDDAVAAGAISADAADALRQYVAGQRVAAIPDEEQFRLITGFNDIFVSIAAAILLFAVGWIGQSIGQATGLVISDHGETGPSLLAPLAIAATSWGLALFFTAKRRMALPSILLLLAFVGGVLVTSDYVADETLTFLRLRLGLRAAEAWWGQVDGSSRLRWEIVSPARAEKARGIFFRYSDKEFSFTDCTSFVVMRELKLREALTTDRHFAQIGFVVKP